jgi:hypothetical protein
MPYSCVIQAEMRNLIWAFIILPLGLAGQTANGCAHTFETAARSGHEMAMSLRSGDITISGTEAAVLRVSCTTRRDDSAEYLRISFAADHLTIRGGSNDDLHINIEVPRSTHLIVRASAGNLNVSGISGNKDIELNAGNLTIDVGAPGEYRRAEASVMAGNLLATAFGISKDGLFRNFNQDNPAGRYRLRAHLLAGNLVFK